jgi:hypothetical protein
MTALVSSMKMPQTFSHVARMKWGSLIFPDLVPALMTSDRPVIRTNSLCNEDSHIIVPIGPKRIFYATNTSEMVRVLAHESAWALVERINLVIVRQAHKYVYDTTDRRLSFVQEHMSAEPAPLVSAGFKRYPHGQKIKSSIVKHAEALLARP